MGSPTSESPEILDYVLEQGGEGVVLRDPDAESVAQTAPGILKYKPSRMPRAGHRLRSVGQSPDRQGRPAPRAEIGALIVDYRRQRLELGPGLTDPEREFGRTQIAISVGPAVRCQLDPRVRVEGKVFKKGETVTFEYRNRWTRDFPKGSADWQREELNNRDILPEASCRWPATADDG